jgi:hypothetical protein
LSERYSPFSTPALAQLKQFNFIFTESEPMHIAEVEIYAARKPSFIANARVTLSDDEGNSVTVTDFRVLRNKQSELWVAVPNYTIADGKGWIYEPTIILSRKLQFEVSEAVLAAYTAKQASGGAR